MREDVHPLIQGLAQFLALVPATMVPCGAVPDHCVVAGADLAAGVDHEADFLPWPVILLPHSEHGVVFVHGVMRRVDSVVLKLSANIDVGHATVQDYLESLGDVGRVELDVQPLLEAGLDVARADGVANPGRDAGRALDAEQRHRTCDPALVPDVGADGGEQVKVGLPGVGAQEPALRGAVERPRAVAPVRFLRSPPSAPDRHALILPAVR